MPTSSSTPKPKRGAPYGNTNARKHGLTPRARPPVYGSEKMQIVDLSLEIAVLRRQVLRLEEAALNAASLPEAVEVARVIAQTASALSRLIRAQVIVFSADSLTAASDSRVDWDAQIKQALAEVNEELFSNGEPPPASRIPDQITSPDDIPPGTDPTRRLFLLLGNYPK